MPDEEQQDVEQQEAPEPEEAPEPQAAEESPEAEAAEEAPPAEESPEPEVAEEAPAAEAAEEAPAAEAAEGEAEAPADEPAEEAAAVAEAPKGKPKRKRLPRSQRRQRTKPKREKPAERKPIVRITRPETAAGRKQERRGVVVSNAMDKTIVVRVDTVKAHRRYKKVVRRSTRFHAHDAENVANVGDVVRIVEMRPLSKLKTWRLVEVLEQAK